MDWQTLIKFNCTPPSFILPRTKEVETKYLSHIKKVKESGRTMSDYIKNLYMKDCKVYEPAILTRNTFPYDLEKGIEHFVLWFNPEFYEGNENFNNPIYCEFVEASVRDLYYSYEEYPQIGIIHFENSEGNRSINGVRHAHVFVKLP